MSKSQPNNDELECTAIEWLTLLRSSSVTPRQQQQFFEWLEASPAHQRAFIAVDQLWQRGGALAYAVQRADGAVKRRRPSALMWFGTSFASLCLFSLVFFFVLQPGVEGSIHYQTGLGERREIVLTDGSKITLNVDSQVEVNVSANDARSADLLRGEVFFKVTPDRQRPFTINTVDGVVVVVGTQFSVRKSDSSTEVTVVSGRVRVNAKSDVSQAPVELVADQQSEVTQSGVRVQVVDAHKALAWRDGMLRFEGAELAAVIAELNRYYHSNIELENAELASLRVVAVLSLDNDLEANLDYLKNSLDLASEQDQTTQIIRLKRAD